MLSTLVVQLIRLSVVSTVIVIVQLGAAKHHTRPLTEDYMYMNPRLGLVSVCQNSSLLYLTRKLTTVLVVTYALRL